MSVLLQADRTVEIIVVDDASTEDLGREYELLEQLGVQVVRLPSQRRGAAARNVGIRIARSDYISLLDSDDIWLPGHLDLIRAFIGGEAPEREVLLSGLCLRHAERVDAFTPPPWPAGVSVADYIYVHGGRVQTSMLTLSRALALEVPFDETLIVNQDTDFAIRLGQAGAKFVFEDGSGIMKDETDRDDRLSLSTECLAASYDWYHRQAPGWRAATRAGFHLRDRAWRLIAADRRMSALFCLLRANLPPVSLADTARMTAEIAFGRRRFVALRRQYRHLVRSGHGIAQDHPANVWHRQVTAEAGRVMEPVGPVPARPDEQPGAGPRSANVALIAGARACGN